MIGTALDALEASGTLATARFAESFVRSRAAKGQGPMRIRAELAERGVADEDGAALLKNPDFDWAAAARAARAKRFGAALPREFKERARQARFLQQRGFDGAAVRAALELEDSD